MSVQSNRGRARGRVAMTALAAFAAASVGALTGCDPNAKASESRGSSDQLSREWESCASSLECADGLRCFQQVCRTTVSSIVGDYQAAVGARALASGSVEDAIRAYAEAVTTYQAEVPDVPAWLYCELGNALAADSRDPDNAERAARALHRCIRQVPGGSAVRQRAMHNLAILGDVGLDPIRLKLDGDAEKYLTKGPVRPKSDDVKLAVTGDAKKGGAAYDKLLAELSSVDVRAQLVPCWEANYGATKSETMRVTVPVKYYFHRGEYEEDDRWTLKLEKAATDPATACVVAAIDSRIKSFKGPRGGFNANLAFEMK